MQWVRPADSRSMARLVASLEGAEPTYAEIGATLRGERPVGFRHDQYGTDLGRGTGTFATAVRGLQSWQTHRLRGVSVFPEHGAIAQGATVVVTLGVRSLALAAPCRIIAVVDEPTRWGFAYGTLPGHPEQGEEAFVVSITESGLVRFEVTVFSRPGQAMVRLSGPLGRWMQRRGTHGYLRALKGWVDRTP